MQSKRKTTKTRYRGFSLGKFYYVYAYTVSSAKSLLRAQALNAAGRYDFTSVEVETSPGSNKYVKILTTIL